MPSCSKTPGDSITHVLNECAKISHESGKYGDPAAQANFIAKSFQGIDVTDCPADFRMAYQDHINAWQESAGAYANNTGGAAFVEGLAAGFTGDPGYIGQAAQQANYATQQINNSYYTLTQIAAQYGARIPRSVAGE
jgi:hypothetical protein